MMVENVGLMGVQLSPSLRGSGLKFSEETTFPADGESPSLRGSGLKL